MRDLSKRFISDEDSTNGRPKAFTHKWECFYKLRIYEHYGTPEEVKRWKEVYDKLLDVLNTEEFMKYFKDTSNT